MNEVYCKNCKLDLPLGCIAYPHGVKGPTGFEIGLKDALKGRGHCKYYKRKWWKFWLETGPLGPQGEQGIQGSPLK